MPHLSDLGIWPSAAAVATFSLAWQLHQTLADICPASLSSTSSETIELLKPSKSCPDFKDDAAQNACCPSQITQGAYFCCTVDRKAELEAHLAAEARRQFIAAHVSEIVFCSIFFLIFLVIFGTILCKKRSKICRFKKSSISSCDPPLVQHHRISSSNNPGSLAQQRFFNNSVPNRRCYRPAPAFLVQSSSSNSCSKAIAPPYEAPPPYDFVEAASQRSQLTQISNGSENTTRTTILANNVSGGDLGDWNCLLENERNSQRDSTN